MRRRSCAVRRAARAIAAAMALAWPSATSAEEIKVMQGMDFSAAGTEYQGNASSPFARLPPVNDWNLDAYTYSKYSLRFQGTGASGQVVASAQGGPSAPFALSVDQAWIKASFGEGWALAFGRRYLKWKDGGFWHPSDVVNNYLSWSAAGAALGAQAPGRDTVELIGLLPFMDFNLDISAATALAPSLANPGELPYYFQVGSILYPLELKAKAAVQSGFSPLVGASANVSLESGSLYADALWLQDRPIAAQFELGPSSGSWFRYCAGASWTFSFKSTPLAQSLFLQVEYLRQDDGLTSSQMTGYFDGLAALPIAQQADQAAYGAEAGKWNGRFFALGRDYAYAAFSISEIAQAHIGLSAGCVANLNSLSFAVQSSLTWSPRYLMSICLSTTNYLGSAGGEAFALPISGQYSLTLSRSF